MVWVALILFACVAILILNIQPIITYVINHISNTKVRPIKVFSIKDNTGGEKRFTAENTGDDLVWRQQISGGP